MLVGHLVACLILLICGCCCLSLLVLQNAEMEPLPKHVVNLGPVERGFATVFAVPSTIIEPNIARYLEFRTSQLALFQGQVYASRRVLYRSIFSPQIVVVLGLDVTDNEERLRRVLAERRSYCERHGYGLYARYIQDFAAENKPVWEALGLAPIRLLRQAMLAFPSSEWFWMLSSEDGEIRNAGIPLEQRISPEKLRSAVIPELELNLNVDASGNGQKEHIVLTNFAVDPKQVQCIISFDSQQMLLSSDSMVVRQSLVTRVLLETLADPVFQEHGPFFWKQDHASAALTHLARWHPQLMRSIALVKPEWLGTNTCDERWGSELACLRPRQRSLLRVN